MLCFYCYGRGGGPYQAPNLPMKILGSNCRDIYNAVTVRALKAHIKGNSSDIFFLSETKTSINRMNEVLRSIKFSDMCVVKAKGAAGGICVVWKRGLSI